LRVSDHIERFDGGTALAVRYMATSPPATALQSSAPADDYCSEPTPDRGLRLVPRQSVTDVGQVAMIGRSWLGFSCPARDVRIS
jgi:hypothetical protein